MIAKKRALVARFLRGLWARRRQPPNGVPHPAELDRAMTSGIKET